MASLRDLANAVQNRKTESTHLNETVNDKLYNQLKKSKEIIDNAYSYFAKYIKADKKFNYVPCIILLLVLAAIITCIKFFGEKNAFFVLLIVLSMVLGIIIFEIFIFKPYRNRMKLIDDEMIEGMRILNNNKNTLEIIDVKYWYPQAIDYILDMINKDRNILFKDILENTDKYINENSYKKDITKITIEEIGTYNFYKPEYDKYKLSEENDFKFNKRVLKGTENYNKNK